MEKREQALQDISNDLRKASINLIKDCEFDLAIDLLRTAQSINIFTNITEPF